MAVQHSFQHSPSIYVPESATITRAEPMTALEKFLEIRLDCGKELGHAPGQFVGVSVAGIGEAPISVSSSPDLAGSFELVVRKVGRVTAAIHELSEGDTVGVRGPFGKGFPLADDLLQRDILFVCGGIGLVPVRSAINYTLAHRGDFGRLTILYGSKGPADRLFVSELEEWAERKDVTFLETVDRGDSTWTGNVGVITTLIPKVQIDPANTRVVMCGPPIMYKFAILGLGALGIHEDHIYVSLERRMKCGVGKCGHCQINGLYTCLDGPVFRYTTIKDAPEAI